MQSPVSGIRFIHRAINREANDLDKLAQRGPLDPARVAFFRKVLRLHTEGEEKALFPAVEERVKEVVPPYLLDHREEEALLAELDGPHPARTAAVLREHLRLHIKKENQMLVPLLERLLTPAEQVEHVTRMMSVFSPADMAEILPWMINWLDIEERRDYLELLECAMPPERFGMVLDGLKSKLEPDVWSTLGR